MLALGWSLPTVFAVVGVPAVISGISMLAMGRVERVNAVVAH